MRNRDDDYRARDRARKTRLYRYRRDNRLCVHCGAGLQEDDRRQCVECVPKRKLYEARYQRRNRSRLNAANRRWKMRSWGSYGNGPDRNARLRERYYARKVAGLCVYCGTPAVHDTTRCQRHLEYHRAKTLAWFRKHKRPSHHRVTLVEPPRTTRAQTRKSIPRISEIRALDRGESPADDQLETTRGRLLRALRFMDWSTCAEILHVVGLAYSEDGDSEWNAFAMHLSRMCKQGLVEKRGDRGGYDYRVTAAGRAAADHLIKSTIRSAA